MINLKQYDQFNEITKMVQRIKLPLIGPDSVKIIKTINETPKGLFKKIGQDNFSPHFKHRQIMFKRAQSFNKTQRNVQTIKYIGIYNNQLGILSRKEEIKPKCRNNRSYSLASDFLLNQEYKIHQYFIPKKLGQK
ncbi:hypothetical protein pb186bvf_005971 [Paramecium bursaria]